MLTRSKSANVINDTANHDKADMPSTSAAPSQVSVKSNTSNISERTCRQRALEAKRKAAEKLADLERRQIELEKQFIHEQTTLELEAIELEESDDVLPNKISHHHRSRSSSVDTENNNMTEYNSATNCDHRKKTTEISKDSPTHDNCQMNKFLARQSTVKDLPFFSGAPEEWLLFYSQFKVTTKLCDYSDEENISRLMKCLRGEARDSVHALLTSASNLDKIIQILKLRFGRADIIIDSMLSKIRHHRDIRPDDMTHLLRYATDIQNIVAVMISTDQASHLHNPILIREVLSKLPSNLKYQWGFDKTRRGRHDVSLEDVAEWLMEIANSTAEFTTATTSRSFEKQYNYHSRGHRQLPIMTTNKTNKQCHKCKANHELDLCPEFQNLSLDDRWNYVTQNKLCFSCLSSRHQLKSCTLKIKCGVQNCNRAHHRVLHAEPKRPDNPDAVIATTQSTLERTSQVMMKVIRVVVSGSKGDFETAALLDEGAAVSLIDSSFAERAGIDGPTRPLRICGARGMSSVDSTSRCVSFKIRGRSSSDFYNLFNVRTINNLCLPVSMCNKNIVSRFDFVKDYIDDNDLTFSKIDLLIGQDNIDLIVTRQIIQGPRHGPIISRTSLGYVLHGTISTNNFPVNVSVLNCSCEDLNEMYKKSFRTEDFGVSIQHTSSRSRDDLKALEIMKKTTRYIEPLKRWETGLLWRSDHNELPNSYNQALIRLQGIRRKMTKLPEFAEKYRQKIQDYERKGYARKLTEEEVRYRTTKTWYLPHFAVFNPNKPNKLRFVTDAAAKSEGKSLNDFLLPGPDFLNSLPGMLLQFRCHRYAVMGDIQEMFHQVLIIDEDRQAQRFLWENDEYQMNVMIFGAVCSPSSAQYVKNVNALRFSETHPDAVKVITDHHYMDDLIYSVDTIAQGKQLVDDVIYIHAEGGFNMTSFMSNSKEILQHLPHDKLSTSGTKVLEEIPDLPIERVLGVKWIPSDDKFVYSNLLEIIDNQNDRTTDQKHPTKRHILKVCMSVFDPLGFLLFVTIRARIILQEIWRTKIGWDDEVTGDLYERWRTWLLELRQAVGVHIPRWLLNVESDLKQPVEIHIFCDASTRAFATVAYMRSKQEDGNFHVSLLMARGRVAPLKILSVPRLELQGSLLGARMAHSIRQHIDFKISRVVYWSDSKTVLKWIRSDAGRFKPFVAHRISEISELTSPGDWRWVPTHLNHADLATRDKASDQDSGRWVNGPDFLRQDERLWPIEDSKDCDLLEDAEMKALHVTIPASNEYIFDVTRFSRYWRLVRATAWIIRFKHNLTHKDIRRQGELLADEIKEAELLLIKESQLRSFPTEYHTLQTSRNVDKTSRLYQLIPFIDAHGLIRAHGRIDSSCVEYDTKNPIILAPTDNFSKLLVLQYHIDAGHNGKEKVYNDIRQKFWLLRGRSAVKATWRTCQVCKNARAKPTPPIMGQLPIARLTPLKVFAYTGLDYFGPITVKIGRRREKRYGALFTCMTVRAIHIELVDDLTSDSAIMPLRRFIARRGTPHELWSDNATTFKGADNELRRHVENLDEDRLRQFLSIRRIQWKFICPNSPHRGGCWERMVRAVKTALKATLNEQAPTVQILSTVLAETEFIVNSRPLTNVPLDHNDDLPLTPNHFIFGRLTDTTTQTIDGFTDRDLLRKSWRHSQRLADLVWKRWLKEYLPTLTKRGRWFQSTENIKLKT